MRLSVKRVILGILLLLIAFIGISFAWNYDLIRRTMLGGVKVYETTPPELPADIPHPAILVFSKTNGFRHEEAIPAANALFAQLARENGWGYFQTENGATFDPAILSRFDAVVFNNVSGDVFTPAQRAAFKQFVENGGGFVGVHGAGGDFSYDWRWYVNDLIGAQFIGHPMGPQFQQATVRIEDKTHPSTCGLPDSWTRTDEWYSFEKPVRKPGYHVLATLDEATYSPKGMFGQRLAMGKDHPIAWWHLVGKGRVFYSAMGHQASAYAEPDYRKMLLGALTWVLKQDDSPCAASAPRQNKAQ
jgi:type 1 glutamine amidotransferase